MLVFFRTLFPGGREKGCPVSGLLYQMDRTSTTAGESSIRTLPMI